MYDIYYPIKEDIMYYCTRIINNINMNKCNGFLHIYIDQSQLYVQIVHDKCAVCSSFSRKIYFDRK